MNMRKMILAAATALAVDGGNPGVGGAGSAGAGRRLYLPA